MKCGARLVSWVQKWAAINPGGHGPDFHIAPFKASRFITQMSPGAARGLFPHPGLSILNRFPQVTPFWGHNRWVQGSNSTICQSTLKRGHDRPNVNYCYSGNKIIFGQLSFIYSFIHSFIVSTSLCHSSHLPFLPSPFLPSELKLKKKVGTKLAPSKSLARAATSLDSCGAIQLTFRTVWLLFHLIGCSYHFLLHALDCTSGFYIEITCLAE